MKVIVAGSRSIENVDLVYGVISGAPFPIEEIVSGGATGVDQIGEMAADEFQYSLKRFPAEWEKIGKGAGFFRNTQMAEYADALIAIWDGESKGTQHMIQTMLQKKKPVYVVFSS